MAVVVVCGFAVRSWTAEVSVDVWFDRHHTPVLDALASGISWAVQPPRAILIGIILACLIAWWTTSLATGAGCGLAMGLGWGSSYAVKLIVDRPRPDWALLGHHITAAETDPSFPSGHVTFVASVVVVLALVVGPGRRRVQVMMIGTAATLVMACVRLYAGVHYPTDVLAGLVYGTCAGAVMFVGVAAVAARTGLTARTDRLAAPALARLHRRGAL